MYPEWFITLVMTLAGLALAVLVSAILWMLVERWLKTNGR